MLVFKLCKYFVYNKYLNIVLYLLKKKYIFMRQKLGVKKYVEIGVR